MRPTRNGGNWGYETRHAGKTPSFGSFGLCLIACLFISVPTIVDLPRWWAGLGVLTLLLCPLFLIWYTSAGRIHPLREPILALGFMWVLAVSAPTLLMPISDVLYTDRSWLTLTDWSKDEAANWMFRCFAGFSVGYWALRVITVPSTSRASRDSIIAQYAIETNFRLAIGVLGLAASVAFIISMGGQAYSHLEGFSSTTTFDQITHEIRQFSKLFVFLYFYSKVRDQATRLDQILIKTTLLAYVVIFTISSSKIVALEILAMWALGSAGAMKSKVTLKAMAVGVGVLVAVYCIFEFVTAYRFALAQSPPHTDLGFTGVVSVQFDAILVAFTTMFSETNRGDASQFGTTILDRLAYYSALATMFDITHGYSPYENSFETFLVPLLAFIPRDFVGDKVQFFNSANFALLLGWNFGGFSVTIPGSLFWAWGYVGMVLGMLALGCFFGLATGKAEGIGWSAMFWRVMMLRLLLAMIDLGVEFQGIVISWFRTMAFLLVIGWFANRFRSVHYAVTNR
jgi:hypothetical protein